jgi:hypothetical protein
VVIELSHADTVTAANPGGRVVLAVYADRSKSSHGQPLWVQQIW